MTDSCVYCGALSWPPSVNGYWRAIIRGKGNNARPAQILSKRGRDYRTSAIADLDFFGLVGLNLTGRLNVTIKLSPPTRRKFDLDNYAKGVLDALVHARTIADDSQIDRLLLTRGNVGKPGSAVVTFYEIGGGE